MRNKRVVRDMEDKRLTAGERRLLRQLYLRLHSNDLPAQPAISNSTDFEDELARVFGELKSRNSY
jgi:hypothetical protein